MTRCTVPTWRWLPCERELLLSQTDERPAQQGPQRQCATSIGQGANLHKVSFAKLYDRKTPITAADLLDDRVLPFFEEHDVKLLRVLTDRGSEFCSNPERHEYELYLAVEDIDHSRTKTKSPQTNGICECLHKTALKEFYPVASTAKMWPTMGERLPPRHLHQAQTDASVTIRLLIPTPTQRVSRICAGTDALQR
jgi:hypothetical protein